MLIPQEQYWRNVVNRMYPMGMKIPDRSQQSNDS